MGENQYSYSAIVLIAVGVALIIGAFIFLGLDLSTLPFYFSVGAALIVCGIVFFFVRFQAERRYCASCMLSFALFAFLVALAFTLLFSPTNFFRFGMGWLYALIFLICGALFWFIEPKGSGTSCSGIDCSGCDTCGHGLLLFIVLLLCGIAYILETAGSDPLGLAIATVLIVGALLNVARIRRK
ncbi:MAG: hypothetical protein ACFFCO_04920 [Promethearchaeota archaeon]